MPKSTFKWVVGATVSAVLLTGCGFINQDKTKTPDFSGAHLYKFYYYSFSK
ncbi:hypothetical protein ACT4UL_05125 [Bacillus sp. HC-TM]